MGTRKRIGMYSPYVPEHEGGGERFFFSVAEILSTKHDVSVLIHSEKPETKKLQEKYGKKFHLDLSRVNFVQTSLGTNVALVKKLQETARFDVLYYVTDGSVFFSLARKNILHIQFPFTFPKTGLLERLKLKNWQIKNANSQFTQEIVENAWKTKIPFVHYPYIDSSEFVPAKKENIILSVGRFFTGIESKTHCKRQDILVKVFENMCDKKLIPHGWRLVLIGSIDPGKDNEEYAAKIAKDAKGYPIKIIHNASYDVLRQYYSHASIYWHAAGFGVDEKKEPTRVEHFGISTVEAMASGAVPVVVGEGGQKEIISTWQDGFFWSTEDELIQNTYRLISDEEQREKMAKMAREKALSFGKENFEITLWEMLR